MTTIHSLTKKIQIASKNYYKYVLTPEALRFLTELHLRFNQKRTTLLQERKDYQAELDKGALPDFPKETLSVREGQWTAAPIPEQLQDRRVEITGPVDRKMFINALNSGAKVFMADFEDSCSPTWDNLRQGQENLMDAVRKTITLEQNAKTYQLNQNTATLLVRPHGLHLEEKHILMDGEPTSGSLIDFGLYYFHNIKTLLEQGSATYFYLPKLDHYKEAR